MLVKKSHTARLSTHSTVFFQLGLALSLFVVYIGLEWKTVDRTIIDLGMVNIQEEEAPDIPITERVFEVKPPPPPPPAPEVIEIVANEKEIIETVLESTETDESEFIKVDMKLDEIQEVIEEEAIEKDIPFAIIEEPPVYPGCTGNKEEKKKCLQDEITKLVNKNYRTDLSQELGLTFGKKKVYVMFKIDKTGKITSIKARGPHARLEKEAIRVVELIPQMTPGKQRSRPVSVSYTLPITLLVQE